MSVRSASPESKRNGNGYGCAGGGSRRQEVLVLLGLLLAFESDTASGTS